MNRVPRIYIDADLSVGREACLAGTAHHHVAHVLRLREGARLCLFNGDGQDYHGTLQGVTRHEARVVLEEKQPGIAPSRLPTTLALGISRARHFDLALQKATELGVTRIRPLVAARSPGQEARGTPKQQAHWRAVITSACEQCGRAELPRLDAPEPVGAAAGEALPADHLGLLLSPAGAALDTAAGTPADVTLCVGPEGGFDAGEEAQLLAAGYRATSCGPRILRTETAPLAVLAVVQFLWGDWR